MLFVDDESRGDFICHFACLLFQVMKLPFHNFFVFLARSSLDLRHRPLDPLGSASPPQVAQSFRQPFATSRVKRVNIKRIKIQKEKHKEMMTSLHKRMSREPSVSLNHKKHTIAAKPCLNRKTDAFSLVDSGPATQTFSHAQITPTRDLLFRSWWPFPPLLSLISLGEVSCPLPSDLLCKTSGEKKGEEKMKIKTRK